MNGVRIGTFNYDVDSAENKQSYSVGLYGLEENESQELVLKDYQNEPFYCGQTRAHSGHGSAFGCSSTYTGDSESDTCSNVVSFTHDQGKASQNITFKCLIFSRFSVVFLIDFW